MNRLLPIAILSTALYTTVACGGPSTEVVVTKPKETSPATVLGDEVFQKSYDDMWADFQSDVDEATSELSEVIRQLRLKAQEGGYTSLTARWDTIASIFATKGEVRWDHIQEKKVWKENYPGTAFPERFTRAVKACRNAYDQARDDLRDAHRDLATRLTKANQVERAGKIMGEANNIQVSGKSPVGNVAGRPLAQRMVGRWTHPLSSIIREITPDGTYQEIYKKDQHIGLKGPVLIQGDHVATIKSDGWTVEARLSEDGERVAFRVWKPTGEESHDGQVCEKVDAK